MRLVSTWPVEFLIDTLHQKRIWKPALISCHLAHCVCRDRLLTFFIHQPSNNGPFSAPPGKTVSPTWQSASRFPTRCHSVPSEENVSPPPEHDPNALYDNYRPPVSEPNREAPSSPPLPPERKFLKGDQLMVCLTFCSLLCSVTYNITECNGTGKTLFVVMGVRYTGVLFRLFTVSNFGWVEEYPLLVYSYSN